MKDNDASSRLLCDLRASALRSKPFKYRPRLTGKHGRYFIVSDFGGQA
jgi:hypothetical protein